MEWIGLRKIIKMKTKFWVCTEQSVDMEEVVGVDEYNKNTLCEVL